MMEPPMSTVSSPRLITTEELLAMPDDGVERWIINGELREWGGGKPVTVRNWIHSAVMMALGGCLKLWRDQQPAPRGRVVGGEAGIRLTRNPDVTVGVDVGYISAEVMARQTGRSTLIEGVPLLAVEIRGRCADLDHRSPSPHGDDLPARRATAAGH
jgi:hypothetical protein